MVNTSALESRGRGFKSRSRQFLEFHLCSFISFFHWFQFICVMYIYIYIYIYFAQIPPRILPGYACSRVSRAYIARRMHGLATRPFISPTRFAVWLLQGTKVTLNYRIIRCPISTFQSSLALFTFV